MRSGTIHRPTCDMRIKFATFSGQNISPDIRHTALHSTSSDLMIMVLIIIIIAPDVWRFLFHNGLGCELSLVHIHYRIVCLSTAMVNVIPTNGDVYTIYCVALVALIVVGQRNYSGKS